MWIRPVLGTVGAEAHATLMTNEFKASNTTDATVGQSLLSRVQSRMAEIEGALGTTTLDGRTRRDLQMALDEVQGLLTGDLDNIPRVVSVQLNNWLEANKHLDEHHDETPREVSPETQVPDDELPSPDQPL